MKLLLVDDEPLTLEDMADLDWGKVGIDEVITAGNGTRAYELAVEEKPEVILTDIEMPKMNGIELAEKVSAVLPETKFIYLTAHDNFGYAQAAVTNHILSYILKPLDENELLQAVREAVGLIRREREKVSYQNKLVRHLERSRHFLMGYLFDALDGSEEDMENLLQILNIVQPRAYYTAIIVTLPPSRKENGFANDYRIFTELNQLFASGESAVLPFFNSAHLVYFVTSRAPFAPASAQSEILALADSAKEYLDKNHVNNYLVTVGNSVLGIENCEAAYRSALDAIAYSSHLGFNTIICITDVESASATGYFQATQDAQFFNLVKAGNFEGARFLLQRMFHGFEENGLSVNEVQHICHSVLARLTLCMLQRGQNPDILLNKSNALNVLRKYSSLKDLETFMIEIVDVVISSITLSQSQKDKELITSIKKYIHTNPETSLTKVAEHFHHSPSYLSHIFPKETGDTIRNYIIKKRIDCAKDLLKNSEKSIGQIAEEIGYKNQQHFSSIFSKATGMTPSDYRRFKTEK